MGGFLSTGGWLSLRWRVLPEFLFPTSLPPWGLVQRPAHSSFCELVRVPLTVQKLGDVVPELAAVLVNPVTVIAALSLFGWTWWSADQKARELLDSYESRNNVVREGALRKLTAAKPAVRADFLEGALLRPGVNLNYGIYEFTPSLGFGSDFRNAVASLVTSGRACRHPVDANVCAALASYVDRPDIRESAIEQLLVRFADKKDYFVSSMGDAFGGDPLMSLAQQARGDSASKLAAEVLKRLKDETDNIVVMELGYILAALANETKSDFAAQGAQQIEKRLKNANGLEEATVLGYALDNLKKAAGEPAAQGAQRNPDH